MDDARVRVAEIAGCAAAARQIEPHVHTFGFSARDRIRHDDGRPEQHVGIAHILDAAAPVRHIQPHAARERLVDAKLARPLPLRLEVLAAACLVDERRKLARLLGRAEQKVLGLRRLEEPVDRAADRRAAVGHVIRRAEPRAPLRGFDRASARDRRARRSRRSGRGRTESNPAHTTRTASDSPGR